MDHDEDDLSVTVGKQRRNGKHNTRKQEAEGRESFNRMSGHVFRGGSTRSCQDIYANRASSRLSFRLYALRFSWRICIRWIDSPFLSRFPSYPLSLSLCLFYLSLVLRSYALSIFTFYSRHIPASTRTSRHVTHDNIGQFAYETRRYRLFQSSLFLHTPISRYRDELVPSLVGLVYPLKLHGVKQKR